MKIKTNQAFKTLDGQPLENEDKKEITLGLISINALLGSYPDEKNLAGTEKVSRYKLAVKLSNKEVVDLESEDIVLLKKLIAKGFNPLIVGQAFDLLEGK